MILGVILAGGRGLRLGEVIKANIQIAGVTLVDRVAVALSKQCDVTILSTGNLASQAYNASALLPYVADAPGIDAGPVGGLAAAVAWARTQQTVPDFILTAAVDTPFFPQDFADRAIPLMRPGINCVMGAAVGTPGEREQAFPTNCLWRTSAIAALPELLNTLDAPHGLRNVVDDKAKVYVTYPDFDAGGCFANVNTPSDMERCVELANSVSPNAGLSLKPK